MSNPPKSATGFTFLEAVVALFVLVVCLNCLGPIMSRVSAERQSVVQKENALSILNNELILWISNDSDLSTNVSYQNVLYHLEWTQKSNQIIQLCITWNSPIKREQVICGNAKR